MATPKTKNGLSFVLGFHGVFFVVAAVACGPSCLSLLVASDDKNKPLESSCSSLGLVVLCLVVGWNLAFAMLTYKRHPHLFDYWCFLSMASALQVIPDWFLVDVLGTLNFPDDGAWKIGGAVSCYMAGMWSIPLLCILCACHDKSRSSSNSRAAEAVPLPSGTSMYRAAMVSLVIFGGAEHVAFPLHLWHCTETVKHTIGHAAVYVLPAEAILGPTVLMSYHMVQYCGLLYKFVGAIVMMLVYTGALAVSFLFIEGSAS
jgi:hypothetical protein